MATITEGVSTLLHGADYFYVWSRDRIFASLNHALVMASREAAGREASPTAGVIDSRSVKTTESGSPRGYDAGKKIKAASAISSPTRKAIWSGSWCMKQAFRIAMAPRCVLASIRSLYPWLHHIFTDGGYAGEKLRRPLKRMGEWTIEIIKRSDTAQGFEVLPRSSQEIDIKWNHLSRILKRHDITLNRFWIPIKSNSPSAA